MYNRKKRLVRGEEMIVLWIITLCMTAIFAYMTLKQNGLKRFVREVFLQELPLSRM